MSQRKPLVLLILLAALIGLLFRGLPAAAHPQLAGKFPNTPLMLGVTKDATFEGDIYTLNRTTLVQHTTNEHNRVPIVSPPGDAAAYLQVPDAYAKLPPSDVNRLAPADIFLMDLKTFKATAIATQPDNVSYTDGQARYTLRSQPAWSPDGKLLAWTEITTDQPSGENADMRDESLVVYDVASKTTTTLVPKLTDHRVLGAYQLMSEVSPGSSGMIAVKVHASQDLDPLDQEWLFVYDAKGQQLAKVQDLETTDPNYESGQLIWLSGLDKPYVSCVICNTQIDPNTGAITSMNGTPELYSTLAPDGLSLYYGADSGSEGNVTWIIALKGKQVSVFDSVRITRLGDMAISPDGMQIAAANYVGQGSTAGVYIYSVQDKQIAKVKVNVTGLGWGATSWRVRATN